MAPDDRKYMQSHEWARKDGDVVTVGITAFAVEHLSDLTFLDLPEVGTRIEKGERFGEIESVKAVSDLFAPIGGEVIETNEELVDSLEILTQDAFEGGWMMKLKVDSDDDYEGLLDAQAYEKHVAEEASE